MTTGRASASACISPRRGWRQKGRWQWPLPQQAARDHGFAAVEFLASVVEFDGFDDLTLEGEGKYARAAPTPQKLAYALAAMRGARAELKAFADAFNADGTYDAAQEYYFDLIASGRG